MPFAINQGVKIYWDEVGEGAPLLLIMGLGYPSDAWYRTRPLLSAAYRTIALDNRGAGRSDVPPGPYSISLMASDAAAVLDAAGVGSAHVLGVSMGGMIAQEFALQYPARVRSLILGCTSARDPNAVPAEPEAVELLMSRANMSAEDAAWAAVPFIYSATTPRERIEEDMAVRRPWFPRPGAYLAQLQAILSWESSGSLSRIKAPTLVIHGESDRLVPAGHGRFLAEMIPGAKLVLLADASHIFWTDQPEQAQRAIMDFLESQPGMPATQDTHTQEPIADERP